MQRLRKLILIVWCVAVTACLIYVPWVHKQEPRRGHKVDYVWESKSNVYWRLVVAPVVLKVAALTVVCGTAYLLTIKRREL